MITELDLSKYASLTGPAKEYAPLRRPLGPDSEKVTTKKKSNILGQVKDMLAKDAMFGKNYVSHAEGVIQETLPNDAKAKDWIDDFVHSDNERFAGKSKAKRIRMGLGAYYAKQRANEGLEGAVEPLIGEDGKKNKKKKVRKEGGPDLPIQLGKGVPNRFSNYGGRDTGAAI